MTKVKGPKDGKIVQATFDGKAKENFPALNTTKDLVLLSIVGNEYCSGDYLGAIVKKAVETHSFTTFLIADEIYWHNLCTSESPDEAIVTELQTQARALGNQYLLANFKYFLIPLQITEEQFNQRYSFSSAIEAIAQINAIAKEKNVKFEICTWNQWTSNALYPEKTRSALEALYTADTSLRSSVVEQASEYAKRHTSEAAESLLKYRSMNYLKAESPAVVWLAAQLGYNFIVYPGECPKPFVATANYFLKNQAPTSSTNLHADYAIRQSNPKLLANWLEVNFTRSYSETQVHAHSRQTIFKAPRPRDKVVTELELVVGIMTTQILKDPEIPLGQKALLLSKLLGQFRNSSPADSDVEEILATETTTTI